MKNYKEHKDSTLVDMTLLGDERAFEELVKRHEKSVKAPPSRPCATHFHNIIFYPSIENTPKVCYNIK